MPRPVLQDAAETYDTNNGLEGSTKAFQFVKKEPAVAHSWIDSQNGVIVQNWHFRRDDYQVLTCVISNVIYLTVIKMFIVKLKNLNSQNENKILILRIYKKFCF